jgi:hypothetical protein
VAGSVSIKGQGLLISMGIFWGILVDFFVYRAVRT